MRGFVLSFFAVLVASAYGIAPLQVKEERIPDKYLIVVDAKYDLTDFSSRLNQAFNSRQFRVAKILKTFRTMRTLSLELSDDAIPFIRRFEGVAHVEEDGVVHAQAVASWGLDRIDQRNRPLDDVYSPSKTGAGVNVYVIDTGINPTHVDFGGRAYAAYDAVTPNRNGIDCNGHGTHCAGTVAGSSYGVAKSANVFGVRVLGCRGSGTNSGVVEGMEWVANNHASPAVASMSLGGGISTSTDNAVVTLTNAGVTVVVAAGNSNADACNASPARAPSAITVGATTSLDTRASYSNWGTCIDIFAPGSSITSAWIDSNTASNTISGTSMACPHVAGVAALTLQGTNMTPAQVTSAITTGATPGVVSNANSDANLLLYSNF